MGTVKIIGISDCLDRVCAAAGRISTQNGTALEIYEKSADSEKNAALIKKVTASGHTSTVEHMFFNLAFENVSVVVEQFMIEFRLASFTVKSRRYVDFSNSGYYRPRFKSEDDKIEYELVMDSLFELYRVLCESGVPREDARFVLPYCFYSNFYCSLNARELIGVLRAMLFARGREIPEIYALGLDLLRQAQQASPGIFESFNERYGKYDDGIDLSFLPESKKTERREPCVELIDCDEQASVKVARFAVMQHRPLEKSELEGLLSSPRTVDEICSRAVLSSRSRALEAVYVTAKFCGVSLSTLTHFARHRMQSLAIPSLTCCNRENYIVAPSIEKDERLLSLYHKAFEKILKLYNTMTEKGYLPGETVYCLLSGNTVDILSCMNARQLKLFLSLRCCNRAQWEIRLLATELLRQLRKKDKLFSHFGPSCCFGPCPEGRLSCGMAEKVRQRFKEL